MDELRALIMKAVGEAAGDDPFAVSLSGGLDSSTVYCAARALGYRPLAFHGYYDQDGFDERKWAHITAGYAISTCLITPFDFVNNFDEFAKLMQQPYEGVGAFGQFCVAGEMAKRSVRVCLSGEGADELFGGYVRLYPLAGLPTPPGYERLRIPDGYPDTLEAALAWEMEHLPSLLALDERILGHFGIESRAPFMHKSVAEYALALAPQKRVGKGVLRDAVRGLVPDKIVDRSDKMGFPAPYVYWMNGPLRSWCLERIGYLPDIREPYARAWFHELIDACK